MAIAFVTSAKYSAGGSSGGTTGAVNTTGANFLVAVVGNEANTPTIITGNAGTMSDSKSNVWAAMRVAPAAGSGNCQVVIYVAFAPTVGASHTFTTPQGFTTMIVGAFSGVSTAAAIGSSFPATSGTGTNVQAGSITPGVNNCIVIAGMAYRDTTTITVDSGFTIADQAPFIAATAVGSALAYLIQTSATAVNPKFSWTNSLGMAAASLYLAPPAAGAAATGGAWGFA